MDNIINNFLIKIYFVKTNIDITNSQRNLNNKDNLIKSKEKDKEN